MSGITEFEVRTALRHVMKSDAPDSWSPNFDFRERALDSLDHATLALLLEEKYGIKISDEELTQLRTITSIVEFAAR